MPEPTIFLILSTSFVVGFSGAMMPGPLLVLTMGQAAKHGVWSGPLVVLGHAILELLLIVALFLGLSRFFTNDVFQGVVGIIGGLVLVVMGFTTARQGWRKAVLNTSPATITEGGRLVVSGAVVSASNPYWIIWWATIGLTYLLWSSKLGFWGITAFYTSHISSDLVWYALVSFIVVKGRRIISDSVYQWFLIVCGLGLVGLGGYFLFSGIRFIQ